MYCIPSILTMDFLYYYDRTIQISETQYNDTKDSVSEMINSKSAKII